MVEAVGTWFAGFVGVFAVILAWIAFNSEDFARRLEQAQASRSERAKLQQEADLVTCAVRYARSDDSGKPGIVLAKELNVWAKNGSSYVLTDLTCHVPQLGRRPIRLADVLLPGEEARQGVEVAEPFEVHEDHRELYESATFTFLLGRVPWATQYGQLADRLDPGA